MKKFLLFFVLLSSWGYTRAQLNVSVYDSITVLALNGDTLRHAWTGGVNSPQFSEVDLNLDGINDLFIFDRSINRITTFINKGTPNKVDYQLAHGYEQQLRSEERRVGKECRSWSSPYHDKKKKI